MLLLKCDNQGSHKGRTLTKTCLKVSPSFKRKNVHCVKAGPILTYERFVDYPPTSVLQERWANSLTDVFCNSDLQIPTSVLSSILQAMTSEPTSIQQSWFVSEHQWVTVGWHYCCNAVVRFSSMFELKSGIVLLVNNKLAEHRLLLCAVCSVTTTPTIFHAVKGAT